MPTVVESANRDQARPARPAAIEPALAATAVPPAAAAPRTIRRSIREDGIWVLTFDRPDSSANIFDRRTLLDLAAELDSVAAASRCSGLVLASAKKSIFVAGADLKAMTESARPADVKELVELGQDVMNRLAALPMPTVAAIHGAAVGGGYEVCLACDYRVASLDSATRIGLPEIQLGLLPAWGGSTRLPRLVGLPKALEIILAGKTLAPKPALKRGLVDELTPAEYLLEAAVRLIGRGKPRRSRHFLVNNRLAATLLAMRAGGQVLKKTRGHYPAVLQALDVVTRGISKSIAGSLALELDGILELTQTDACRNLIQMFFLQERARKRAVPGLQLSAGAKPITRAALIGAGIMGAGIAQWLSSRKTQVILKDVNAQQVARGMGAIAKIYADGLKRHAFTAVEAREGLDRIYPASADVPLARAEIIIEAAVENLELKKQIFRRLDQLAGPETILATNTSALPISELAAATCRPERVVGLHFFNPVHRMQLVEIVAGRRTSPEVLQRVVSFVQQIGKLPVIVKDSPGFLVNRILMPYLIEAGNLFEAGAGVGRLDEAMLAFGMPMGPMRLLDEVGIDVGKHVARTLAAHYPDRLVLPGCMEKMVEAGLLGRKAGRGFYLHPKGSDAEPNPAVSAYQTSTALRQLAP